MDRALPAAAILLATALVVAAMWWAGRGRLRRAATLRPFVSARPDSDARLAADVLYVATTEHDAPLERLAVPGLAFRGKAGLAVHDEALVIAVRGEDPIVIPRRVVRGVGVATWAIDRVVERDGLVFITWMSGDRDLDSYFRILDPAVRNGVIAEVERMTDMANRNSED